MQHRTGFESFVGKKVIVDETPRTVKIGDKDYDFTDCKVADSDTVIKEIRAQAGEGVRVWLPGSAGTCDYVMSRLNVRVKKQSDGTYEISEVYLG